MIVHRIILAFLRNILVKIVLNLFYGVIASAEPWLSHISFKTLLIFLGFYHILGVRIVLVPCNRLIIYNQLFIIVVCISSIIINSIYFFSAIFILKLGNFILVIIILLIFKICFIKHSYILITVKLQMKRLLELHLFQELFYLPPLVSLLILLLVLILYRTKSFLDLVFMEIIVMV